MNYWMQSPNNIYVAAHRGWSEKYPENTMESFCAAVELGVDQLEFDVRVTKDNELVVIHDATVDRTTDGTGLVCEKTLQELKALDAGGHKGEQFHGCKIPTLRELMELVKDHETITLDVELKEYPTPGWETVSYEVCDRVIEMLEEYGFGKRVVINTFSGKLHEYIRGKYGDKYYQHSFFPVKELGECTIDPYSYAYCCCMFPTEEGEAMANAEDFEKMTNAGVQPWCGAGVKTEELVNQAIARGACLITCNNPDEILKFLRKKGYHK